MKLVDTVCKNCGANLQVDLSEKTANCPHCGVSQLVDDEVRHVVYDNAEEAGYQFEKGRQRARNEYIVGNAINNQYAPKNVRPEKKGNTWLWVIGWLLFFPIPLTIILMRSNRFEKKTKLIIIAIAWVLYLAIAVGGGRRNMNKEKSNLEEPNNLIAINISAGKDISLKVDETYSGRANINVHRWDEFSSDEINWFSDNPQVATISCESQSSTSVKFDVHAIAPGDTYVYAVSADGGVESEKIHIIVQAPIVAESVDIVEPVEALVIGETFELVANIIPANAEDQSIIWSSSNDSVAMISDGILTAVGSGEATITAITSNGKSNSATVSVDGSRRMVNLSISRDRDDSNNIGDEWSYLNTINDATVSRGKYSIAVGDTLVFRSRYSEDDNNPDIGEKTYSYTVTEDDFNNGFEVSYDVYVTENGGQNSGKSAHFIVTYSFSVD